MLRRAVVDRVGARPSAARAEAAAAAVKARLESHGYVRATVATAIDTDAQGRRTLRFDVAAGRRARLGRVELAGERLPARVREDLDLSSGAIYDGPEIEHRLETVRNRLRRDGHYEANAIARATPAGISPAGDPLIDVTITIVPGPLVVLRFEGDPVPEARRADLVPVAREASVDEDLLEDSLRRIVQYLHGQGHWKAQVTYRRDPTPNDGIAVTFNVKAGEVFRVASVDVAGAQALSRAEIATVLHVAPGDVFVEGAVDSQTAALVERYRRAGYRDVRIEQVVEERDAAGGAQRPRRAGRRSAWSSPRARRCASAPCG